MRSSDLSMSILRPVPENPNAWVTVHTCHLHNVLMVREEGGGTFLTRFQVHVLITGFSRTTVHTACSSAPPPPRCHPLGPNGLGSQLHATQTFPRPAFGSQPQCLVSAVWPCPSQPIFMDLNLCQLFLASGDFFRWDLWPNSTLLSATKQEINTTFHFAFILIGHCPEWRHQSAVVLNTNELLIYKCIQCIKMYGQFF